MKKLQLGALALVAVLTVGGATTFASQNENENENKLGTASIAATLTTPATKATAEEIAQYEKMIKDGTASIAAIVASEATMTKAVSSIYTGSIITLLIIISLGGISAYLIADKALKPVQVLNENIKNISGNNLLANLEVQGPHDEIKELSISFNQMLAKLNNAFTSQKRFNASVAHELKTPLAAIKTNIDVLNDGEQKTVEEYKETLDIVEKSVGKMNSMIETLLDLVKEENTSLDDQVYVVKIIEDVVDDLTIIAETNHIALDFKMRTAVSPIKRNCKTVKSSSFICI